jgi:DNA-binding ferritin-like protein
MEQQRFLKRDGGAAAKYTAPTTGSVDSMTAACVSELMNAATAIHKLHLKVSGSGSYAAHKVLNELYDALPGHADDLAEGFQGASEKLLTYKEAAPRTLNTVAEAIDYLKEMTEMVTGLQAKMPYSEIVNDLDMIKSTINSGKYKLIFLK